jgi:hypothetical protein
MLPPGPARKTRVLGRLREGQVGSRQRRPGDSPGAGGVAVTVSAVPPAMGGSRAVPSVPPVSSVSSVSSVRPGSGGPGDATVSSVRPGSGGPGDGTVRGSWPTTRRAPTVARVRLGVARRDAAMAAAATTAAGEDARVSVGAPVPGAVVRCGEPWPPRAVPAPVAPGRGSGAGQAAGTPEAHEDREHHPHQARHSAAGEPGPLREASARQAQTPQLVPHENPFLKIWRNPSPPGMALPQVPRLFKSDAPPKSHQLR